MYPATDVMTTDSCMIRPTMDAGVAPRALRMPISLVRSLTTIIMMLLTPTIPAMTVKMPMMAMNIVRPAKVVCTCS